jgi:hypothetical protein
MFGVKDEPIDSHCKIHTAECWLFIQNVQISHSHVFGR